VALWPGRRRRALPRRHLVGRLTVRHLLPFSAPHATVSYSRPTGFTPMALRPRHPSHAGRRSCCRTVSRCASPPSINLRHRRGVMGFLGPTLEPNSWIRRNECSPRLTSGPLPPDCLLNRYLEVSRLAELIWIHHRSLAAAATSPQSRLPLYVAAAPPVVSPHRSPSRCRYLPLLGRSSGGLASVGGCRGTDPRPTLTRVPRRAACLDGPSLMSRSLM